ncbi:hypothetical protein [Desulfoluna spongiiphila]|uniref:hypothetical protein n=1 Tax=Desulfoluna spongiiphila TaxID=419481 RepID=UPI001587E21F|nr:hypothetical protein [Desulfoluna spongiiphila]
MIDILDNLSVSMFEGDWALETFDMPWKNLLPVSFTVQAESGIWSEGITVWITPL